MIQYRFTLFVGPWLFATSESPGFSVRRTRACVCGGGGLGWAYRRFSLKRCRHFTSGNKCHENTPGRADNMFQNKMAVKRYKSCAGNGALEDPCDAENTYLMCTIHMSAAGIVRFSSFSRTHSRLPPRIRKRNTRKHPRNT